MSLPVQDRSHRNACFAILIITILGAGLRFQGLGTRDFWFDESCTFVYVSNLFDWQADSNLLVESTNLPYYALLRGWVNVFGESEASFRSFSAVASTLTIPLLGWLGWQLGGIACGMICSALCATHPLHIHYAHEARAYALWVFLLTAVLCLLIQAVRRDRWRWWAALGFALWTCLHLHYFTAYFVPACAITILLANNRRQAWRRWIVTVAAVSLAFIPYLLWAVLPAARGGGGTWISQSWSPYTVILESLWAFLPAGGYPAHLRGLSLLSPDTVPFSPDWLARTVSYLPLLIVISMATLLMLRRSAQGPATAEQPNSQQALRPLFLLALLPLALALFYSILIRPNYLPGRYDLVSWPAFVVWLGLLITAFARTMATKRTNQSATPPHSHHGRENMIVAILCLIFVMCSAVPILRMANLNPPTSFHHVRANQLAELAQPNDLVITFSYDRDYLQYYLHRAGFEAEMVAYPSWLSKQVGWVDTKADLAPAREGSLIEDTRNLVSGVQEEIEKGSDAWVLLDSIDPQGTTGRGLVNRTLFDGLQRAGLRWTLVDEPLMILKIATETE